MTAYAPDLSRGEYRCTRPGSAMTAPNCARSNHGRPSTFWPTSTGDASSSRGHVGLSDVVTDLASSRAVLQAYADKSAADTGRIYGIWTGDKLVGGVLFRTMDIEHGGAEACCWLEPSAAGKGLTTEAVRVIIDWAVEGRGIHRVEWRVSPENEASLAMAQRLGMTKDGVLPQNYCTGGRGMTRRSGRSRRRDGRAGKYEAARRRNAPGIAMAGKPDRPRPCSSNNRIYFEICLLDPNLGSSDAPLRF
jgi:ribosomal-protein-serine acetyltransferase